MGARTHPNPDPRYCPAIANSGEQCRHTAGWGTQHKGEGRCKNHGGTGGRKPTHGRYSKYARESLGNLIAEYEADPDPLNLLPEVALLRALLSDFLERHRSAKQGDRVVNGAAFLVNETGRLVARIERIRAANAVSTQDLDRIMREMGRVVDHHVTDDEIRQRIHDDWLAVHLS